ncbi:hypothetical protein DIPPA_26829 [Diplonema papillatum]|nr:hypothetical protein DIPPA_26829 [Diplonema papillatum]
MGGNASPDLANLYCYWCEKQYIDGLVAKGLQEEARNHADSVRFIDDFLTWGVRPPPEDIYGMEYGETSKGVDDVVFLGMRIRMERNDKTDFIRMSVLDKGEEFPWNPIKYTHVESTVPRNTGTSIFKGALIRAARICNNMPDLKVEVMKVYYRLRNRGFSGRELRRTFDTFVAQTYGKYELDARVLSRFYHFVGKAYDEGRPTNEEKPYISIRTPQPPDGSPKHPPGRTSPQSTSPHKSEPTSTTHPATKPTNPPGRNGITNIRNSCFFAASVQFLARRTSFRLQLANLTHLDTNQQMVQRLFTDFDAGQNIHGTMATLRSLVFNTTADDSAHRDVHELLTWIRSCVTGDDDDQATVTYSRLTTLARPRILTERGGGIVKSLAADGTVMAKMDDGFSLEPVPSKTVYQMCPYCRRQQMRLVRRCISCGESLLYFPTYVSIGQAKPKKAKKTIDPPPVSGPVASEKGDAATPREDEPLDPLLAVKSSVAHCLHALCTFRTAADLVAAEDSVRRKSDIKRPNDAIVSGLPLKSGVSPTEAAYTLSIAVAADAGMVKVAQKLVATKKELGFNVVPDIKYLKDAFVNDLYLRQGVVNLLQSESERVDADKPKPKS